MRWISDALSAPKSKQNYVYDVLERRISTVENNYRKENIRLKKELKNIVIALGMKYAISSNIFEYIEEINTLKKKLLIIIAAKDTPGMFINEDLQHKLEKLGTKIKLTKDKHWCGYVAVISHGKLIFEDCKYNQIVEYKLRNLKINMSVLSAPLHAGNDSQVIINGKDYSVKGRGLNFVIYDYEKKCVTDSVTFDTHVNNFICHRI